jgi:hypothetical protein
MSPFKKERMSEELENRTLRRIFAPKRQRKIRGRIKCMMRNFMIYMLQIIINEVGEARNTYGTEEKYKLKFSCKT